MNYSVEEIIGEVRKALDMNEESNEILASDSSTLSVDDIIRQKIEHGVKMILNNAPLSMIDTSTLIPSSTVIEWEEEKGIGAGSVRLPDDFLRLHSFKMSDWKRPIADSIGIEDPRYAQQRSKYGGIRGNTERPIVAIIRDNEGQLLEFFSCNSGEGVTMSIGLYIQTPKIVAGAINIPEKLYIASLYQIAGLTAMTLKDPNYSNLFAIAKGEINEAIPEH